MPRLGPVLDKCTIPVEKGKFPDAGIFLCSFDPDYVLCPDPMVFVVPLMPIF